MGHRQDYGLICAICELTGVYAYRRVNGKYVCCACLSMCSDEYRKYIAEVVHKAQKNPPNPHLHRKIEDPDAPGGNML